MYFAAPCFLIDDDSANWTRAKTHREQRLSLFTGLERPPRFPWQRSGVAPAQFCVMPVSKLNRRHMQPHRSQQLPSTVELNGTVNRRVNRVFHAPFTPRLWVLSWWRCRRAPFLRRLNEATRRLLVFDSFSVASYS
jgi:hypothetical protein